MSRYYDFFCPVKLMAGEQALELLPDALRGLGLAARCCSPTRGSAAAGSPPCWPM